jgi:hypothetical protein
LTTDSSEAGDLDRSNCAAQVLSLDGCSRKAAPNNYARSKPPALRGRAIGGCRALRSGALETHTYPSPAIQNEWLTLRGAGPFMGSSTPGQPRGQVAHFRSVLKIQPSRAGGPSNAARSGILAPRYLRDRCPQRWLRCLQYLRLRSSPGASVRPSSSPARSAWLRRFDQTRRPSPLQGASRASGVGPSLRTG